MGTKSMEDLRDEILNTCNSSGLPLECIMFVLKDCWRDAESTLHTMKQQFPNGVPQQAPQPAERVSAEVVEEEN